MNAILLNLFALIIEYLYNLLNVNKMDKRKQLFQITLFIFESKFEY